LELVQLVSSSSDVIGLLLVLVVDGFIVSYSFNLFKFGGTFSYKTNAFDELF
jgi:hypothetical protein